MMFSPSSSSNRRSTRVGRATTVSQRNTGRSGNATMSRLDKAQKWVKVPRPPAPGVDFVIPTWVPVSQLTPQEVTEYLQKETTIVKTTNQEGGGETSTTNGVAQQAATSGNAMVVQETFLSGQPTQLTTTVPLQSNLVRKPPPMAAPNNKDTVETLGPQTTLSSAKTQVPTASGTRITPSNTSTAAMDLKKVATSFAETKTPSFSSGPSIHITEKSAQLVDSSGLVPAQVNDTPRQAASSAVSTASESKKVPTTFTDAPTTMLKYTSDASPMLESKTTAAETCTVALKSNMVVSMEKTISATSTKTSSKKDNATMQIVDLTPATQNPTLKQTTTTASRDTPSSDVPCTEPPTTAQPSLERSPLSNSMQPVEPQDVSLGPCHADTTLNHETLTMAQEPIAKTLPHNIFKETTLATSAESVQDAESLAGTAETNQAGGSKNNNKESEMHHVTFAARSVEPNVGAMQQDKVGMHPPALPTAAFAVPKEPALLQSTQPTRDAVDPLVLDTLAATTNLSASATANAATHTAMASQEDNSKQAERALKRQRLEP